MNYDQPPVLTSPEEIKDVIKQITGIRKNLEHFLVSIENDKEGMIKFKVNTNQYIDTIISFCNQNNHGDEFGSHLAELAEAYESLKEQLFQLTPEQLKIQLSRMENGSATEGLKQFVKKNNIELN